MLENSPGIVIQWNICYVWAPTSLFHNSMYTSENKCSVHWFIVSFIVHPHHHHHPQHHIYRIYLHFSMINHGLLASHQHEVSTILWNFHLQEINIMSGCHQAVVYPWGYLCACQNQSFYAFSQGPTLIRYIDQWRRISLMTSAAAASPARQKIWVDGDLDWWHEIQMRISEVKFQANNNGLDEPQRPKYYQQQQEQQQIW